MRLYVICTGSPDGTISSMRPVPHVSSFLLEQILTWRAEGCSDEDVVTRLRLRTVPVGYTPKAWIDGTVCCALVCLIQQYH